MLVCLLITVGILCIHKPATAYAAQQQLTGETDISTVINPPGTAQTPQELNELNTAIR